MLVAFSHPLSFYPTTSWWRGQRTPWGECHLFRCSGHALCPGTDPVLNKCWKKKGWSMHDKLTFFGLDFLRILNKRKKTNHKERLFGVYSAQSGMILPLKSVFNFHIPITLSSICFLYSITVLWEVLAVRERERACSEAGNVQCEHFLPDNAAFFTEWSNSSTVSSVLKNSLKITLGLTQTDLRCWPELSKNNVHKQAHMHADSPIMRGYKQP